jgi:hypothetical protein
LRCCLVPKISSMIFHWKTNKVCICVYDMCVIVFVDEMTYTSIRHQDSKSVREKLYLKQINTVAIWEHNTKCKTFSPILLKKKLWLHCVKVMNYFIQMNTKYQRTVKNRMGWFWNCEIFCQKDHLIVKTQDSVLTISIYFEWFPNK